MNAENDKMIRGQNDLTEREGADRARRLTECAHYHEEFARGVQVRCFRDENERQLEWSKAQAELHNGWAKACRDVAEEFSTQRRKDAEAQGDSAVTNPNLEAPGWEWNPPPDVGGYEGRSALLRSLIIREWVVFWVGIGVCAFIAYWLNKL